MQLKEKGIYRKNLALVTNFDNNSSMQGLMSIQNNGLCSKIMYTARSCWQSSSYIIV